MKKILTLILILNLLVMPVLALELDTSIDDSIRKNYNPSKIEEDMALPALPRILDISPNQVNQPKQPINKVSTQKTIPKPQINTAPTQNLKPIATQQIQTFAKSTNKSYAVLKQGTKIKLKSLTNISDGVKRGTKVSLISTYPVTTTYFTIPMGTVFKGEIVKVHKPQFTANGGLVAVKINSIELNDSIQPINAYVTKANHKNIFFNNIKGKRKYAKSLVDSIKPGCHFFTKMMRVTVNLANDGSSIVLTPFSVLTGTFAVGGNVLVSPVIAFFKKGGHIFIHAGSEFEIKLKEDVFIYN